MKHENNYFTRIFLIFFVGKKKGHIFAPSKMTLSMIVPLCNGSTAGFGSVSPGSNPGGTTLDCPSGEIGIHASFRYQWLHGRVGSSPILGTNSIKVYDFRL